jgi:hypothetical protein
MQGQMLQGQMYPQPWQMAPSMPMMNPGPIFFPSPVTAPFFGCVNGIVFCRNDGDESGAVSHGHARRPVDAIHDDAADVWQ